MKSMLLNRFLLIILGVCLQLVCERTLSIENSACFELSKVSCSNGVIDDGTAKVPREQDRFSAFKRDFEEIAPEVDAQINNQLSDPNNLIFRRNLINALGLERANECLVLSSIKCQNAVVRRYRRFVQAAIMPDPMAPVINRTDSLEDINRNLLSKQQFKNILDWTLSRYLESKSNPPLENKFKTEIFFEVKNLLSKRIGSLAISDDIKKKIQDRIHEIQLNKSFCSEGLDPISQLYKPDARFSSDKKICIEKGMLTNSTSEFEIVYTLAHELSHSFDPCMISYSRPSIVPVGSEHPFTEILSCLRSADSIGAKKIAAAFSEDICDGGDQINEAMADFFAYDVLGDYVEKKMSGLTPEQKINGFTNVWHKSCKILKGPQRLASTHPFTEDRIDRLMLASESVRDQMGCKNPLRGVRYCGLSKAKFSQPNSDRLEGGSK